MTFEKNEQHAERGILKFAAPFWGKPRWAALFVAFARQIQDLENAAWDVITKRMVANATGAQLRVLGGLVGQIDPGLGEEVFRSLIRVRIRINRSEGRRNDVIEVMQLLGILAADRVLTAIPPAAFRLDLLATPPMTLAKLHETLSETLAGGVGIHLVYGGGFSYSNATAVPSSSQAWGNLGSGSSTWSGVISP